MDGSAVIPSFGGETLNPPKSPMQTRGSVRLTLRASPVDRGCSGRPGRPRWRQAMQIIRDSCRSSTGDVEDALGVSRPVTIRLLRAMEEAGLITWVGKSEKDPCLLATSH